MDATAVLGAEEPLLDEERLAGGGHRSYQEVLARLSHQSVVKHFDAYADVPWDEADGRIDADDPRWEAAVADTLGITAWFRDQPAQVRSRLGLHMVASFMKIGAQFENVLQRGLLEFALQLPNGSPEFRYAYHECIEEGQHSLMFQEFVNRTGFDVPGLGRWDRIGSRQVVLHARRFPALFFIFVLGGEDPIDHVQRTLLRSSLPVHPLLRRIMQIHVTEEARHLCFARHYLREHVPSLGLVPRTALAIGAPLILGQMAKLMMQPSRQVVRTYGIPRTVIAEAYTRNPLHRANRVAALAKIRTLCCELGLVTSWSRLLWEMSGIWSAG